MGDMPWVRFFFSDWLGGTRGMSAAESGIYITLIATMYERGEPIPEEHSRLARLCGASNSVFKATLQTLVDQRKIVRTDAGLWNERVEKERVYRSGKSEVGREAANARWGQKSKKNKVAGNANAMPTQCRGNANQKPEARVIDTAVGTNVPPAPRLSSRKPAIRPSAAGKPIEVPDWQGSAEDQFWAASAELEAKGIGRSHVGKLANILGGDFEQGLRILRDAVKAKKPAAHLAKTIQHLTAEARAELPPEVEPALPPWITEARAYGYPVEREGTRWRFAGALYNDAKEQVGA